MANRVGGEGGHSGMESTDAPSINKAVAITASTLKKEKVLLLLPSVPCPSVSDASCALPETPAGPRGPTKIKPTKINVKNECFNSKCKMHSRIRDDFSFFFFFTFLLITNQSQFTPLMLLLLLPSVCTHTHTQLNNILLQCESSFEWNTNSERNSHLSVKSTNIYSFCRKYHKQKQK